MKQEPIAPLGPAKQAALDALFADLPRDFDSFYQSLLHFRRAVHERLAGALEPALNDHLAQKSPQSLRDRQRIATWADTLMSEAGVTTAAPDSDKPALLVAKPSGPAESSDARFAMMVREGGEGVRRSFTSGPVPRLRLIPAPANVESLYHALRNAYSSGRAR